MKAKSLKIVLMLFMVAAAIAASYMKPKPIDSEKNTKLETIIPEKFGDWKRVNAYDSRIVNPEVQSQLNEIYSDNISYTYENSHGQIVMLAIAYGQTQSKQMQVHRPEVCYAAQGFQILSKQKHQIQVSGNVIPVMRLVAQASSRTEPITYWIRIGDKVVRGNLEQGFARLSYGLKGEIPDGLLFRVSNISDNQTSSFLIQQNFIDSLVASIDSKKTTLLLGASFHK